MKRVGKFRSIKDTSSSFPPPCPSFPVDYGVSPCAVPFSWESQPGTPRHTHSTRTGLHPLLTPPPSYYNTNSSRSSKKKTCKSELVHIATFHCLWPFSSSSSSSSSSASSGCCRRPVVGCLSCI
ncbi:hypothetical protein ZIOFF_004836 [Zingiber officinale]|uniref:Uncharacterized protein n=1 Tax=Zingiber officinale TaxID=94328 RepID=A0A8J5I0Y5_ZINOF|nr:hypothetical protein ZIOFF_004836 [Zingiber officinale]